MWIALRERLNYRPHVRVKNDPQALDFVPAKSQHLTLFDHLLVKHNFYSSSMSRANLGLAPPWLDASGYDLAIVDTPHFIKINGIEPNRIITILHDLIPLRDPAMESRWRSLFLRKLETTLAMRSNMVFVSRHTQTSFHLAFPNHKAPREFVLYPAIRRNLLAVDAAPLGAYDIRSMFAGQAPGVGKIKRKKRERGALPAGYDPSLPYFVTATSDEPRKNIAALVRAFYDRLRGRANVVILGEIDAGRHVPAPDANVYFPGYVSDDEKVECFRHAQGVVFAS
jgi:glycosyltransferase involved in cell wall biosynthesis